MSPQAILPAPLSFLSGGFPPGQNLPNGCCLQSQSTPLRGLQCPPEGDLGHGSFVQKEEKGACQFPVGHRMSLVEFHDRVLRLGGDSTWRILEANAFAKELERA